MSRCVRLPVGVAVRMVQAQHSPELSCLSLT